MQVLCSVLSAVVSHTNSGNVKLYFTLALFTRTGQLLMMLVTAVVLMENKHM